MEEETTNVPILSDVENNGKDRISDLPDGLIHHILSFLDMTYVIRTSVLAKRWRYFWTSLSTITLKSDLCKFSESEDERFNFVDRVLMLRDSSDIKKFHLDWSQRDPEIATRVNTWILGAVSRNVQDLHISLSLWEYQKFKFPQSLFSCKSLTKLSLDLGLSFDSVISLPKSMNFHLPMLKYLKLRGLSIYKRELTTKLFSSCPVLESLIIKNCCVNLDNVYATKLKYFKVKSNDYDSQEGNMIRLYAPNLTSFICGSCLSHNYALESLSSLVTADFRMTLQDNDEDYDSYLTDSAECKKHISQSLMNLLRGIRNVKDLIVPDCFLQVISGASKLFEFQSPQLSNLRILELQTYLRKNCFPAIAYLLKNSPKLETLYIQIHKDYSDEPLVYPFWDEIISDPQNIVDDWETEVSLPCMMHHLKFVKLIAVQGRINELKFLELLLKNAAVLERVILCCEWGPGKTATRLTNFSEKLHTFPRVSSAVTFMCF